MEKKYKVLCYILTINLWIILKSFFSQWNWSCGSVFCCDGLVVSLLLAVLSVWLHRLIKQHRSFSWRTKLRPHRAASVQLQDFLEFQGRMFAGVFFWIQFQITTTTTTTIKTRKVIVELRISQWYQEMTHLSAEEDYVCGLTGLCSTLPVQFSDLIRCQWATEEGHQRLYITTL